jgi:hypothetical protein
MTVKTAGKLNLLKALSGAAQIKKNRFLILLYKLLVRTIFEFGCIAFIGAAEVHQAKLQKLQNSAIRSCLSLPAFVSEKLLHDASGLIPVFEHLKSFATKCFNSLLATSEIITNPIKDFQKVKSYRTQMHCSPLDILYS